MHQFVRPAATFSLIVCYGFSNWHKGTKCNNLQRDQLRSQSLPLSGENLVSSLLRHSAYFCSIIGILEKGYFTIYWCQLFPDICQVIGWWGGGEFSAQLCKDHNEKQDFRPGDSCSQPYWTINQLQWGYALWRNSIESRD